VAGNGSGPFTAPGPATATAIGPPIAVTAEAGGGLLIAADARILKVDGATSEVSSLAGSTSGFAGDGTAGVINTIAGNGAAAVIGASHVIRLAGAGT
jgi:hypothetical protein